MALALMILVEFLIFHQKYGHLYPMLPPAKLGFHLLNLRLLGNVLPRWRAAKKFGHR
jgi:hypothetical protein